MARKSNTRRPSQERGDHSYIDTAIGVGQAFTGFVPGLKGQGANWGLDVLAANREVGKEQISLSRLGIDPEREQHRSRILKKTVKEWYDRWKSRLVESGVSAGGALAGGIAATKLAVLAGLSATPIGWVAWGASAAVGCAGAAAGGYALNKAYRKICPQNDPKAALLVKQIAEAQERGEEIPQGIVLVVLSGHLSNEKKAQAVYEAWQQGDEKKLARLSKELDIDLRAKTRMPFDPQYPEKTVVAQVTEWTNSGKIAAKDLLFPVILMEKSTDLLERDYNSLPDYAHDDPAPLATPSVTPGGKKNPRGQGIST